MEPQEHCVGCLDKLSWVDPDSFDMNVEEGIEREPGRCFWVECYLSVDKGFDMDMNKLKPFRYGLLE